MQNRPIIKLQKYTKNALKKLLTWGVIRFFKEVYWKCRWPNVRKK